MMRRKKLIIWIIIILVIIIGGYFFLQRKKPKTEYTTEKVSRGNLSQTVSATGKVIPITKVNLSFKLVGRIEAIYVKKGDGVRIGEKIARLDDASLRLALDQARKDLVYQKETLDHMKKKDEVYSSDQRKAQKALIEKTEKSVEIAEKNLADATIYSPVKGMVLEINYEAGEVVSMSNIVASVSSGDKMIIESEIPESDIVKIANGQKAEVSLDAFEQDKKLETEIYEIDPAATIVQDVVYYKIRLKILNPDERLKSGMSADLDIWTAETQDVLMIPMRAIETDENKNKFVKILGKENEIKKVEIKTGMEGDEGMIEIKSGLEEGQEVITYIKNGK